VTLNFNGTFASVIELLEKALRLFGGSPKKVLFDNAKQMVLEHLEGAIAKLKETVLELVTLPLLIKKRIISLLGAPGVGKRHLASTVGINTCTERYTVLFQSEDEVEGCLPVSSAG